MPDRSEIHESITEQMFNGGGDIVSEEFSVAVQLVAEAASISAAADVLVHALAARIADELVEDVVYARHEDDLPWIDETGTVVR